MKSPPLQFTDDEARELVEAFIRGDAEAAGSRRGAPARSRCSGRRAEGSLRAGKP